MRKAPPGAPILERRTATRDMPPLVAIFCEGATEHRCLGDLRARWRVATASVHIVGQVGDPRKVVEEAKRWKGRRRDVSVYVVFDRDEHERWHDAMQMARDLLFVRAVSNPCIELWGLLLHRDQSAEIHRHAAQHELSEIHPKYHHATHPYFDLDVVLENLDIAQERAEVLDLRAREAGDEFGNPTSRFSRAIEAMRPRP
jgi:hypothetical protein